MKKIIDGKMYDTSTAELIFVVEDSNRKWYKTKKGNYFLLYPNGEIIAKTEDEVKEFLGEKSIEKYIQLFGEVEDA